MGFAVNAEAAKSVGRVWRWSIRNGTLVHATSEAEREAQKGSAKHALLTLDRANRVR